MVTLETIWEAQNALRGVARVTPLNPAKALGKNVYIKCENLQLTGAFKLRGAYNKLRSLSPEERERGVIACSAGNHAQGIALSATNSIDPWQQPFKAFFRKSSKSSSETVSQVWFFSS